MGPSSTSSRAAPACLIKFLPGVSVSHPTPAQAGAAGAAMGRMHRALADFAPERPNALGPRPGVRCSTAVVATWTRSCRGCTTMWDKALDKVLAEWPADLPRKAIHAISSPTTC